MAPLAPTKIRTKKKTKDVDAQPESSKPSKTESKPPLTAPISSTKPAKEKKPTKSKPEPPIPTSISRPRLTVMRKKTKKPVPEPEPSSAEDEDEGDEDEDGLHGFSTDDDSSDEDATGEEPPAFDVTKLPTIAKDDATVKHKLEKAKKQPVRLLSSLIKSLVDSYPQTEDRGVLFIGRRPHGFYEDQLKAYFSQFGDVTRLRISRNKKVSRSVFHLSYHS